MIRVGEELVPLALTAQLLVWEAKESEALPWVQQDLCTTSYSGDSRPKQEEERVAELATRPAADAHPC